MSRHSHFTRWICNLFCFIILLSCNKDEVTPDAETGFMYFPIEKDNTWSYRVTLYNSDGDIEYIDSEMWIVDDQNFVQIYDSDKVHKGYRSFYLEPDGSIKNWVGQYLDFLNTEYVNMPQDKFFLVSTITDPLNYEHRIRGGKSKIATPFGSIECILAKSIRNSGAVGDQQDWSETNWKFIKGIGLYELEERNYYDDCESCLSYIRKWTLTDYKLK